MFEINGLDVRAEKDDVGIAHGDAVHEEVLALDVEGYTDCLLAGDVDGYLGWEEDGLAHVDADVLDAVVFEGEDEGEDASAGLDVDLAEVIKIIKDRF